VTFAELMAAAAAIPDEAMGQAWRWRDGGEELQVRDAFYQCLQEEQAALSTAVSLPESTAILALAQRAAGDLCGLLAGQPAELLDAVPTPGEWSIRRTLQHVIETEQNYRANTAYALARTDAEPLSLDPSRRPRLDPAEVAGDGNAIVARLLHARDDTDAGVGGGSALAPAEMLRPTTWAGHEVDVRFRLHRFASHLVEHTIQCDKALAAMRRPPGEARRIVRATWATRGAHQRATAPGRVEELDAAHGARLSSILD
jgi:hypothetical protein